MLLLRKLKRGHLAWYTTPALSIGFAFVFFRLASTLYSAGEACKTSGVVILDSSSTEAVFAGTSEMFFPRGGRRALPVGNSLAVLPSQTGGSAVSIQMAEPLQVTADLNNLAFATLSLHQALPNFGKVTITKSGSGLRLVNATKTDLRDLTITGQTVQFLSALPAGQSAQLHVGNTEAVVFRGTISSRGLGVLVGNEVNGRVVVRGSSRL
jgi:hypothetical protein